MTAAPAAPSASSAPLSAPHFIGIGGAGMSGLAKILALRGAQVSGSDAKESTVVLALRQLGAEVYVGHAAEHVPAGASCIVVSSAIREDNPEIAEARRRDLPIIHRSDALAALMENHSALAVAGTHGKTTTTSMLAVSLTALGLDPSFAIGGDLNEPGSNAHHGTGRIFVAEADESDRSFQKYTPEVAVVLNVELDHHANYASMDEIYESFEAFADRVVPGGALVVDVDHAGAAELARRVAGRQFDIVTVGEKEGADFRILRITPRGMTSEVTVALPDERELTFTVNVPGRHYAHNAVAALAAGVRLGVPADELAAALSKYQGVRRRLQLKGESAGVQVIDSYAHHPTEIAADLQAIREAAGEGRVLVVFQPHLFSRTRELGLEMGQALALADQVVVLDIYPGLEMGQALALADQVVVLDIYPAREDPIPGITSEIVIEAARAEGADVQGAHSVAAVPEIVAGIAKQGDLVLTMGAGDVTFLGPEILTRLDTLG